MKHRGIFFQTVVVAAFAFLFCTSCKEKTMQGEMSFAFTFTFNGNTLVFDSVEYVIPSGQIIRIDNIQYFISDVTFVDKDGQRHTFENSEDRIHYVDSDIPSTRQWKPLSQIPTGVYDYIEFVYGIDSATNKTGLFRNPPESLMFWPDYLGGGYHYMKLNGYWRNPGQGPEEESTFNFHAGIGQTWQGEGDDRVATAFHQNYVPLRDTLRIFLTDGETRQLTFNMEVANWFDNPHLWDFELYGSSIMQNQASQQIVKENAWNVFSIY